LTGKDLTDDEVVALAGLKGTGNKYSLKRKKERKKNLNVPPNQIPPCQRQASGTLVLNDTSLPRSLPSGNLRFIV
jgi:hypothetical protein